MALASSQEQVTKENVESVIYQPVEQIWTSKSSWIISTYIDIRQYAVSVRNSMHGFYKTFKFEDERYVKLINMTRQDLETTIDILSNIHSCFFSS